jgi:Cys-rich four helix bundle protein (predicted Tat secretion target)
MERREMLTALAAAVAGALTTNAVAAEHDHHHHHAAAGSNNAALAASAADCLQKGEACLAHCLVLLGQGDKEMAACAQSVNEMMAICTALMRLAGQNSKHTATLAKLAADVCAGCEKECRKHENQHAECKACAESCAACLKECQKVAA